MYLKRSVVFTSFARGLSPRAKNLVWATQRPGAFGGLAEPFGVPAWRTIPSWSDVEPARRDRVIERAARATVHVR